MRRKSTPHLNSAARHSKGRANRLFQPFPNGMIRRMTSAPHHEPKGSQLPGSLIWQDPESDDPDLSLRFLVPHGAQITMTGPLVGFLLRRVHKPPDLHCQRVPDGWSLTVVVGLSLLFRATRPLRLPASSEWRATLGRLLDLPLRRLVRARITIAASSWDSVAATALRRSISQPIAVKQEPSEQLFSEHFPIRVALPLSAM